VLYKLLFCILHRLIHLYNIGEKIQNGALASEVVCDLIPAMLSAMKVPFDIEIIPQYHETCEEFAKQMGVDDGFTNETQLKAALDSPEALALFPLNYEVSLEIEIIFEECFK